MKRLYERAPDEKMSWKYPGTWGFFIVHLMPLFAIITGVRWHVWVVLGALYFGRMFFVTAGYHRYFSHRTYKLNRFWQFWMAFFAQTAMQKGVLWWAAHHRHHHRTSDQPEDIHSPLRGFWWSHVGWIFCEKYKDTRWEYIQDFAKFPELRFLNKYYNLPAIILGAVIFLTLGADALFMGFFLSSAILWHGTFTINSLSHVFGRRRYVTNDSSRNSALLAIVTLGEGWHNNHHHFPGTARQGFFWWEFDITYYVLRVLNLFGIVRKLKKLPKKVKTMWLVKDGYFDTGMFNTRFAKAADIIASAKLKTGERVGSFVQSTKDQATDLVEKTARSVPKRRRVQNPG